MDEVASQHVNADLVVHYGHACLSQCVHLPLMINQISSISTRTSQIPVIYVFGHRPIDVTNCVKELASSIRDSPRASSVERLVLCCDVVYSHRAAEIAERLYIALDRPVNYREIPLKAEPLAQPVRSLAENQRFGATDKAIEEVVIYIGPESLTLTNLLITHGSSEVLRHFPFAVVRVTEPRIHRFMLTILSFDKRE